MRSYRWALIQYDLCPYKKRKGLRDAHSQRKNHGRTQWEGGHLQVRREASGETKPASILILDFPTPELQENKFMLLRSPSLWYSVSLHSSLPGIKKFPYMCVLSYT